MADVDYSRGLVNSVCRACGAPVSRNDLICEKCASEFKRLTDTILASEDARFLKHCKYCGRPIICCSEVTYKNGNTVKRITKRLFCDEHYTACKNCGSPIKFQGDSSFIPTTCSAECRKIIQAQTYRDTCQERYGVDAVMQIPEFADRMATNNLNKYGVRCVLEMPEIRQKSKETCLEKYGVEYAAQSDDVKERAKETCLEKYGMRYGGHTSESNKKRRETCLENYGVENPMFSDEIKARVNATCLKRHGTKWAVQSKDVKDKIRVKMRNKYGGNSAMCSKSVKDKVSRTFQANYGGHPMRCPEVVQKMKDTSLSRYGGLGFASEQIRRKADETVLSRYGTDKIQSVESVQEKRRKTYIEHYGVDHPMQSEKVKKKVAKSRQLTHASTITDLKMRQNYLDFCNDPREYILKTFSHKPSLIEISETLGGLDPTSVSSKLSPEDHSLLGNSISSMERSVLSFLYTLVDESDIVVHDHSAISPYELGIYLPSYGVAIECNPSATHNSSIQCFSKEEKPLDTRYHQNKSNMCRDRGIFLFHIFGYEWINRQDVIKSMISNLLGLSHSRLYARKLSLIDVSHEVASEFLNTNHLQGALSASVRLGLADADGTLVALMTFNKLRHTMGRSRSSDDNSWELSRFCVSRNTIVTGGASKLFKHFINEYNPSTIISFSDIAHTKGALYDTLGFANSGLVDPGYVWVDMEDNIFYNRVRCQKQNLKSLLRDDSIDIINQTEDMIMVSHGFVKVYDSGKIRWVWNKEDSHV